MWIYQVFILVVSTPAQNLCFYMRASLGIIRIVWLKQMGFSEHMVQTRVFITWLLSSFPTKNHIFFPIVWEKSIHGSKPWYRYPMLFWDLWMFILCNCIMKISEFHHISSHHFMDHFPPQKSETFIQPNGISIQTFSDPQNVTWLAMPAEGASPPPWPGDVNA